MKLEDIDVDGAVRETAYDATEALENGDTRLGFLKKAGLASGAVMGGGAILGALVPNAALASSDSARPPASFGKGDIGILNYALTLEYLESAFYNGARNIHTPQAKVFLKTVRKDEAAHVKALKQALGSKAVKKPKFTFHGDNQKEASFLKAAFTFENEGVHAYSGQAFNIKNPAYLAAALSIVTIEARHASVVGLLLKDSSAGITPDGPFDVPYGANHVLKDVKSLHYIKS